MAAAPSSLPVTLAHAIAYLTRPLTEALPAETVNKIQLSLGTNLMTQYAPTWIPSDPLRGSGRRCLTLSPAATPPRPIYSACLAANINWSDWIKVLGNLEFDLFIDPGCVSVRFAHCNPGKVSNLFTVWSEELAPVNVKPKPVKLIIPTKTLAQQLLEEDCQGEDELFAMIADEIREPSWISPILAQFPAVPSYPSPADFESPVSRSSSRASSASSSGFSRFSNTDSLDSASSYVSEEYKPRMSHRERARSAKVYVDTSKTDVTNYDGGKTTVLTGGVMLGAVKTPKFSSSRSASVSIPTTSPISKKSRHGHSSSNASWRSAPCA